MADDIAKKSFFSGITMALVGSHLIGHPTIGTIFSMMTVSRPIMPIYTGICIGAFALSLSAKLFGKTPE